jgi:hypothetical protein
MPQATVPGGIGRATLIPLCPTWKEAGWPPYLVLLRVGFTKLPMSPSGLVRSYRTVSPLPGTYCRAARRSPRGPGGLFSVALSLGSPPLDVIQHPALWSPDFPPFAMSEERSSDLLCPVVPLSERRRVTRKHTTYHHVVRCYSVGQSNIR